MGAALQEPLMCCGPSCALRTSCRLGSILVLQIEHTLGAEDVFCVSSIRKRYSLWALRWLPMHSDA